MASCAHPHYALDLGINPENGKKKIKFIGFRPDLSSLKQLQARYGESPVISLPCGYCIQCRINYAKEWAVRCVLEALEHENNYFITLTYDDEHLPKDGALHRDHIQKFFKRFRKRFGDVRYFGCGEYSPSGRPHFHLILFGANIPDLVSDRFGYLKSLLLSSVWPFGVYDIGEVNYASCNYVAQYSTKKVFKPPVEGKAKEFIMASNRPGIGATWMEKNLQHVLDYDRVFGSFGSAMMPRYFEKVAERLDKGRFDKLKTERLNKDNSFVLNEMLVHQFDEVEKLLEYKERITLDDFIYRKRGIRKEL